VASWPGRLDALEGVLIDLPLRSLKKCVSDPYLCLTVTADRSEREAR